MEIPTKSQESQSTGDNRIHELEDLLSLLLKNTEESFMLVDSELNIIEFNAAFSNLYKKYFGKEVEKGVFALKDVRPENIERIKK